MFGHLIWFWKYLQNSGGVLDVIRITEAGSTPEFHQSFPRTNRIVVISEKTHLYRKTVLHKNSPTTDAAKENDFRLVVVPVKLGLFSHNEYSGSDCKQSSAFQRENYLVRT